MRGGYRGGPPPHSPAYSTRPNPAPHHHSSQSQNYYMSSGRSSYGSRNSYGPASSYQQSPLPSYHTSVPPVPTEIFVKGSYEQYLDQMSRSAMVPDLRNPMAMYDPYSASYHTGSRDAPPPPPIPSYSSSRDRERGGRPSVDKYDRAVEDFLRRTSGSSSGRTGRGVDSRHKSREVREVREYRGRSRSRERYERERHRGDRSRHSLLVNKNNDIAYLAEPRGIVNRCSTPA
ncbi:hypothetical protein EB796_020285 [Bugula neritina]|uniref:Uncharacterized protein n=1 Tax=Bugula neritina TaxID=10212 RepID=A0A7J7J5K9_BUGNE|nr:hypothetical protein EB796_020285 [Bugula neritina]